MKQDNKEKLVELLQDLSNREKEYLPMINSHIDQALEHIKEAVSMAEKGGIPFYSSLSPLFQNYVPESYYDWKSENQEILELIDEDDSGDIDKLMDALEIETEILDLYDYAGWEHSAVC